MLRNKKNLTFLILSLFSFLLFANSPISRVQEYTLENGLQVFLLEEPGDALVHIEFNCRAGFSSQTQNTCGFFKLFTRLVEASNPSLRFVDVQCNADSSLYFVESSPAELSENLNVFSEAVFSTDFSDELLRQELSKLKKEVSEKAESMSYYINAAIDSRVFSDAPWKHDSGIYPALFKNTTEKKARTYLKEIAEYWYIPKNSAIFISGNINSEQTLIMLKNTFGRFYSNSKTPAEKIMAPRNQQRKYVFHSNDISTDLTQLVIQYTMLDTEECELLSLALGYQDSLFKQSALAVPDLNIPGDEYINVSAAHKRNSSRLIIQTLLQPPEDQKKREKPVTSINQAEAFLQQVKAIPQIIHPEEFEYAKNQSVYSLNRALDADFSLMNTLSSFWTLKKYMAADLTESDFMSETAALMMKRSDALRELSLTETLSKLQTEQPFVFVIINSKDYKANKKAYDQAGFQEINEKNSSWYVQEMFRELRQAPSSELQNQQRLYTATYDNSYYQKNKDSISQFTLSNGICVSAKDNPSSSQTSLLISISGGRYNSYDDIGFEEVMINLLSGLIQKSLYRAQAEGLITGDVNVSSLTELATGQIIIRFDTVDSVAVFKTTASAIIYGEIAPADADRAVSGRKYRKRLENGTALNQMYSKMIETLYKKGDFSKVFDAEEEILLDTDYAKILSAYPQLLNASRYSLILCGGLYENLPALLEESFGLLTKTDTVPAASEAARKPLTFPIPEISTAAKDIRVKVRHTFLTDIPAEKAGPQPAVLIPTTEFLDPVIYGSPAPAQNTKEAAVYNAMLAYICTELSKNYNAEVQYPKNNLNLAFIIVSKVAHTRELDSEYKSIITEISEKLEGLATATSLVREIKTNWMHMELLNTAVNAGTAFLMQKGTELSDSGRQNPAFYLEEYNWIQNATAEDFLEIMEYFPVRPQIRVYSADSKK